jgi:hypothetical protein
MLHTFRNTGFYGMRAKGLRCCLQPGLFRTGDTEQLSAMLYRAEIDVDFLGQLRDFILALQERFAPEREVACWQQLLQLTFSKSEMGGRG